jgi:Fibronectin type III domain
LIRQADAVTHSTALTNCDGTQTIIRDNSQCTIPVAILKASPFSLPWGANVHAKIVATNIYGDSGKSLPGSGPYITTNPDPPINLVERYSDRSPTTLGLTWQPATFTGGDVIIDFQISIAVQGGTFSVLASNLLEPEYQAIGLTPGVIYEFKV